MKRDKSVTKRFKAKLNIRKGDNVILLAGDDKGKKGRVIEVMPDVMRALVEGVNIVSRHTKPDAKTPNGGIVKKEAPVHISNLALVDPKSGTATRIGRSRENGKGVRTAKKSGVVIK
ncbi:MAG: 50S ribosomal protein L24 [Bacteroidota bacterium]